MYPKTSEKYHKNEILFPHADAPKKPQLGKNIIKWKKVLIKQPKKYYKLLCLFKYVKFFFFFCFLIENSWWENYAVCKNSARHCFCVCVCNNFHLFLQKQEFCRYFIWSRRRHFFGCCLRREVNNNPKYKETHVGSWSLTWTHGRYIMAPKEHQLKKNLLDDDDIVVVIKRFSI